MFRLLFEKRSHFYWMTLTGVDCMIQEWHEQSRLAALLKLNLWDGWPGIWTGKVNARLMV
jgi:hypothetical protein